MSRSHTLVRAAFLPLVGAALALPAAAAAADLHVSVGGGGDCSSAVRGCSLAAALASARSGDRVLVHYGTYGISTTVQDGTATGVQVLAAPGEPRPFVDTTGGVLRLTHGTALSGIDVATTSGTALVAAGGLIDRVRIMASGVGTTALVLGSGSTLRTSNVVATGVGTTAIHVTATPARATIVGSDVLASGPSAVAANVSTDVAGAAATVRAVNTIFSGSDGALDLRVASAAGQAASAVLHHSATARARQSVIGAGSSIDQADATLTAEPLFVNRASGDLRETSASPTVDAGTLDVDSDGDVDDDDTVLLGSTDLDDDLRPQGAPDVGSDELGPKPTPTPAASGPAPYYPAPVAVPIETPGASPAPTGVRLPGALPTLVGRSTRQLSAMYTFRLRCDHSVSCRGTAILTRIGGVRSVAFKIPPRKVRSAMFSLTSVQRAHVRDRGTLGLRGLLELRSLDEGSSFTAVRLYPHRKPKG